jgi:Cu/Ag efflux pump CusA
MALNQADVYVMFKPKSEWRAFARQAHSAHGLRARPEIPELDYDFSAPMAIAPR